MVHMNEFLSVTDAGKHFPVPISGNAVRHRMLNGICGIKLKCQFDGKRYVTTRVWIDDFIAAITAYKNRQVGFKPMSDIELQIRLERIRSTIRKSKQPRP